MPERIANIIILGEDDEHQNWVRRYLIRAGHETRSFRLEPLPGNRQCGSQYVRQQFPRQVETCRGTVGRKTQCLLIVITDADSLTVRERSRTLHQELETLRLPAVGADEPIIILIPKWQVETWVKCALGQVMSEDDPDTDRPPVTSSQIKDSAETVFGWARPKAQVAASCVPSLSAALPDFRRIG
jgi:hypothetical protein